MTDKALKPDMWYGWRYDENGDIDYSIDDKDYLESRREYLLDIFDIDKSKRDLLTLPNILNGHSITELLDVLPKENEGNKILSWGCGSGKTNKLKFLSAFGNKSLLIVVKTNDEVNRLVFDIKSLNTLITVIGYKKDTSYLTLDDLSKHQILVTNNWRVLNEPANKLIYTNPLAYGDTYNYFLLKSTFKREYVIFDELPSVYKSFNFDYDSLLSYMYSSCGYQKFPISSNGGIGELQISCMVSFSTHFNKDININILHQRAANMFNLPIPTDNESLIRLQERMTRVLSMFNQDDDINTVYKYIKSINDLLTGGTKAVILDATGDILIESNDEWRVDVRYQPSIELDYINLIKTSLNRFTRDKTANEHIEDIDNTIELVRDILINNPDRRYLLVTWIDIDLSEPVIEESINYKSITMPKRIREKLIDVNNYDITHYGSGKLRGSNEFINCTDIIFIGNWRMNKEYCDNISTIFNSDISPNDFVISEMKQGIYRTRVRQGKSIGLTFIVDNTSSKTVNNANKLINQLLDNLNITGNKINLIKSIISLDNVFNKGNSTAKEDAIKLVESRLVTDEMIINQEINITLDNIFNLLNRTVKEKRKFNSIVNVFKELNITLNII
jgi:hypothetical protein